MLILLIYDHKIPNSAGWRREYGGDTTELRSRPIFNSVTDDNISRLLCSLQKKLEGKGVD